MLSKSGHYQDGFTQSDDALDRQIQQAKRDEAAKRADDAARLKEKQLGPGVAECACCGTLTEPDIPACKECWQHPEQFPCNAHRELMSTLPRTPNAATKFCRYCGTKIPHDSVYCEECGSRL
jgi:hypothetical protein